LASNNQQFNISGNSGCVVSTIARSDGTCFVRKLSGDVGYNSRLREQQLKQECFLRNNTVGNVSSPMVIGFGLAADNRFYFDMDYVGSNDCISFFCSCGVSEIDGFLTSIIDTIDSFIGSCSFHKFKPNDFMGKYESVRNNIVVSGKLDSGDEFLLSIGKWLSTIIGDLESAEIPIGSSHGDLTLSNIIVGRGDNKLWLIDFLDSFIESPINDIVKLRQDTMFGWSSRFYGGKMDRSRIAMVMSYLDNAISEYFYKYEFYRLFYDIFQVLNMLRIMPYCSRKSDYLFLRRSIVSQLDSMGVCCE
jgi:hypothetical protein